MPHLLRSAVDDFPSFLGWANSWKVAEFTCEPERSRSSDILEEQLRMSKYWQEVKSLPRPSDVQISNFVDYVASAHSWYKRLPLTPPGFLFHFFIDANSGCDLVFEGGRTMYEERTKQGFHYSDLPTAEYRKRFGYLQYWAKAGTSLVVPRARGALVLSSAPGPISFIPTAGAWKRLVEWFRLLRNPLPAGVTNVVRALEAQEPQGPAIQSAAQVCISVPVEVLKAGSAELTGIIHPIASTVWNWRNWAHPEGRPIEWPAETGGPETLLQILRFLEENPNERGTFFDLDGKYLLGFHPEIHRLVEPERQRLKTIMKQAIRRMIGLIYDSPAV